MSDRAIRGRALDDVAALHAMADAAPYTPEQAMRRLERELPQVGDWIVLCDVFIDPKRQEAAKAAIRSSPMFRFRSRRVSQPRIVERIA